MHPLRCFSRIVSSFLNTNYPVITWPADGTHPRKHGNFTGGTPIDEPTPFLYYPARNAKREAPGPRRAGCEPYWRSHEMPEILATREQSKPTRLIQAHLYLLLYRAGESNEFMSRRELKSAERRIPTLNESKGSVEVSLSPLTHWRSPWNANACCSLTIARISRCPK